MKRLINNETGAILSDCRCNFQDSSIDAVLTLNGEATPVKSYNSNLHTDSLVTTNKKVFEFLNDLGIEFFKTLPEYENFEIV